jgi:hypothetical protein
MATGAARAAAARLHGRNNVIRIRSRVGVAMVAAAALLIPASSASAALIDTSNCDGSTVSQPFAQWGDHASYKLAPGGDFEGSLSGWGLSGARRITGGFQSGSSLQLPPGSSATSAATCVNASNPSYRFMVKSSGGLLGLVPVMVVSLVYHDSVLGLVPLPLGVVLPSSSWAPSPVEVTLSALPAALANGDVPLSLRFTAVAGTWTVDNLYVDPWNRG